MFYTFETMNQKKLKCNSAVNRRGVRVGTLTEKVGFLWRGYEVLFYFFDGHVIGALLGQLGLVLSVFHSD